MRNSVLAMTAVALLASCSNAETRTEREETAEKAQSRASASDTAKPAEPMPEARKVDESTDLYEFDYSYPAAAAVIPDLKSWLEQDLERDRKELAAMAREGQAASKDGGFPFNPYGSGTEWQVVADLPGWLSLSAQLYEFTGGAHPNHGYDSLVWDKQAGKRLDPVAMFTSKAALSQAIRKPFCAELDKQRAKKREGFDPGGETSGDDWMNACIDPAESTVILGSSNGKAFNRIGVLVGPYEAGPYAEGDYEITLPVTDAVMKAVKPEYRSTFVAMR